MTAPTPEDVAREIAMSAAPWLDDWRSGLERDIAAALRAARAAAIEEAARVARDELDDARKKTARGLASDGYDYEVGRQTAARRIAAANRALGEESATASRTPETG